MQLITYIAWLGAAVSLYGTARYIVGIFKDGTQPRLASWIAWFIANVAMMFMAWSHGAQTAAAFDALSAAGNAGVLIAGAAKRAGQKPSSATDWTCLAIAATCSLVNASFPQLAMAGTLLAMFANLVATWPTMAHAWEEPSAETWQLFAANAGASLLGVIGVGAAGGFKITTIAGPLVAMIGNVTLTAITLGRRYRREITTEIAAIQSEVAEEVAELEGGAVELSDRVGQELTVAAANVVAAATGSPAVRLTRKRTRMIGSEAGA
jgi:hypothetical protein